MMQAAIRSIVSRVRNFEVSSPIVLIVFSPIGWSVSGCALLEVSLGGLCWEFLVTEAYEWALLFWR